MSDYTLNPAKAEGGTCRTGLETEMVFVKATGSTAAFRKQGESFYYNLPSPRTNNLFRLTVTTRSATSENPDAYQGRSDRVSIKFLQLNRSLVAQTLTEILAASDNPEALLADQDALQEKLLEQISPDQLMMVVRSDTVTTDESGQATRDYDIPDNWMPSPVYVVVDYAYNFESEWQTQRLGQESEFLSASQLAIEICLAPIIPGVLADVALMAVLDGPELWSLAKSIAGVPMGGVPNQYGCDFPVTTSLTAQYLIDYKSGTETLSELMSSSQADYLSSLLAEEEASARRGNILIATILGAGIIGLVLARSGGSSL